MKILKRIDYEIYEIFETLFSVIPGTLGKYCRQVLYKIYFNKCGKKLNVGLRVKIQRPSNLIVGNNVGFNFGVWLAANEDKNGQIRIGNNVSIGPYTVLHSGNHNFKNPNILITKQGYNFKKIRIEDDVLISAQCTVLSGVTIGRGSVIAAGSVITKDVPPYSIVAGVPGKIISNRSL